MWVLPLIAAVLSLILGGVVLRSSPRENTNRVFAFLAFMLVLWNLNFCVLSFIDDHDLAFELTRFLRPGAILLPAAVLHLVVVLTNKSARTWQILLLTDYCIAYLLMFANAFDLVVVDIQRGHGSYASVATELYDVFTALVIGNFVLAFGLLVYESKHSSNPRTRVQLRFWLLGAAIALPLGLTTFFPVYGVPIYPLGNLGNVVWAGVVAYAIVRHRIMDVHVALTKGAAYAVAFCVVIVPIFCGSLWLQHYRYGTVDPDFSVALLLMLVVTAVLFPLVVQHVLPRIEMSWLRDRRAYRGLLLDFARRVVRIVERTQLVEELARTLESTLRLDRVAIALQDGGAQCYRIVSSRGTPPRSTSFGAVNPLLACLWDKQGAISRDELAAKGNDAQARMTLEVLEEHGWEVCVPFIGGGMMLGFVAMGPKPDVEAFFAEDYELLETLAAEAAVALENTHLYEELKRSQDIIRRADRSSALGTLAAGIAHEIRNPLVSIQTFFQLAPYRINDREFMTEFLDMTANEVKRISRLINELLSFARSPTASYGAVDLKQLVERVVLLVAPEARKRQLELDYVVDAGTPLVYGDAEQLRQVLVNLAFNAFQATAPGGVVRISTRAHCHNGTDYGRLEVSDTGAGIPADQLDNIFNPFYTTKAKGTGLGLAIVQRIVSEHGGTIAVRSVPGRGTTFTIDLSAGEPTLTKERSHTLHAATERTPNRI